MNDLKPKRFVMSLNHQQAHNINQQGVLDRYGSSPFQSLRVNDDELLLSSRTAASELKLALNIHTSALFRFGKQGQAS